MIFCERLVHKDGCCPSAPDFLPARTDPWLNDEGKAIRQPTGSEMHLFMRGKILAIPLDEVTRKRILALLDDFLPLVDAEWWDDRSLEEEEVEDE